jgi:hypothetical protein
MSYEGYSQVLCANGHLRSFDCWSDMGTLEELGLCSCSANFVYRHMVDETNGEGKPYSFEIASEEQNMTCNMGHKHVTVEVTYKIPNY